MASKKGNMVELTTFKSWGKCDVIGHKTVDVNGKTMVNFVWCKICARHKSAIQSQVRGSAKISVLAFINDTNSVTRFQVRDLKCFSYNLVYRLYSLVYQLYI